MNLSAWSIRKPIPTIVLFLVLTIAGLLCFPRLEIDSNPNIDISVVTVTATQQGAGPAELESQVTRKIEDAVAGLGNIDELSSTVNDGVSVTRIDFVLGTDADRATNDVRNAISQIRQDLPQDMNEPIVERVQFAGGAIMTYAVTSNQRSVEELSNLVDRTISREILSVKGVAQVNRIGGVDQEIRVELSPERLQSLGITATQVNEQIRAFNINLPGGRSELGNRETSIRTLGSAESVAALKDYQIVLPNGSSVPLSSLGTVSDGFAESRQTALFNNQPVVAFSILRSSGSSLVTVEEGVRRAVQRLEESLPSDVNLQLIFTRADDVRESYQASMDDLVAASVLAILVILIYLRDWRATLITTISLPLSIIPTFAVFQLLGYTLNNMTLLAFALSVGILVDDTVVEIENVERHMRMGKTPRQAAFDSSSEIGLAVIATTATIVAVFAPVAFMGGIPGQFFQPFGVTIAVSSIFSTLVARTLTPMLATYLMRPPQSTRKKAHTNLTEDLKASPYYRRFQPYRMLLEWSLRHRLTTLLLAIAFFIGSLMLIPYVPKGLFNSGDTGLSTLSISLPPGTTLPETEQVVQRVTNELRQQPEVKQVLATVGSAGGIQQSGVNSAMLYVNLKPRDQRDLSQQEFEAKFRPQLQQVPGARISFASSGAAGNRKDLSVVLTSENPEALTQAANALEKQMREIPGLVEVESSASLVKPELTIHPDPRRAADQGVSVQAIARTATLATLGDTEANLAKFELPDRQIPIRVLLNPASRSDLSTIENLQVPTRDGRMVPLISVANLGFASGPAQIDRFDRARQVSVEGNLQGVSLGSALEKVAKLPALQSLPPGVEQRARGNAEIMQDIFSRFGTALATAILAIYAILVLLYNGFLHPVTIMMALPLSIGGALLALLITQTELGLFALIGIVLLMGIVTKNSILLVDYTLINMQEGKRQREAIVDAGVSRLRPIMMTAISTIAGMMPIALGLGAGSETRSPMAIAVIGGFITSTLLTLVVVPVIFTYIDNFQTRLLRLFHRKPVSESLDLGGDRADSVEFPESKA